MMDQVTVVAIGDVQDYNEHTTIIRRSDGREMEFYTDGYNGMSYVEVVEFLDFLKIEHFDVIKR